MRVGSDGEAYCVGHDYRADHAGAQVAVLAGSNEVFGHLDVGWAKDRVSRALLKEYRCVLALNAEIRNGCLLKDSAFTETRTGFIYVSNKV